MADTTLKRVKLARQLRQCAGIVQHSVELAEELNMLHLAEKLFACELELSHLSLDLLNPPPQAPPPQEGLPWDES